MTRDETIDEVIREAKDHAGDTMRDRIDTLTAYIAEQREEIRLLNEQVHAANQELLKRAEEITRLREALREIIEKCDDEDWEYMYGDIMQRAKQALTQEPT